MPPEATKVATLLVSCPDQRGIVAALAQVLYGHGANILDSDQHTDPIENIFFQRIRFDLSDLRTDRTSLEQAIREVAERFGMRSKLHSEDQRYRMAIMVSKYDHCLHDLLLRQREGELAADIALVVSNHPDLQPLTESFGCPFEHLPITPENRAVQEAKILDRLKKAQVDLVVLARYMQVLTRTIVEPFQDRIINIHHSFLPAFAGGKPYHQAYTRGVKLIGATAHYATVDLDEGPIIEQAVVRATHRDSVVELSRKGRDLEKLVLSRAVRLHLEDRILVYRNKTVVFE